MKLATFTSARVFLTGVTGFVGKVVLEELLRRYSPGELEKIYVLIRPDRKGRSPQKRFEEEVAASACFSKLPENWTDRVQVIGGDLAEPGCGINDNDRHLLVDHVTHLINCAASVEFDLPVADAAAANITASLNMLEFARWCTGLKNMVNVSTAYVTPHRRHDEAVSEELVPLKWPARAIYHSIVDGTAHEKTLLKETGLPNTYTLTKCLSEHLLAERKGDVPLTIVRPSIVSACWHHPFKGWIDSKAAFAGFVSLIGAGFLRAVVVDNQTLLDIVPCDEVAARIIEAAFEPRRGDPKKILIRHAVAGVANSCSVEVCIEVIESFFRRHQVGRYPDLNYAGAKNLKFRLKALKYHHLSAVLLGTWYGIRGQRKKQRGVVRLVKQLNYLNKGFPYFTHNTFDFRSSVPLQDPAFRKREYIETVCRGVHRFLMGREDSEITFAGRAHQKERSDWRWMRKRRLGNWAIRLGGYVVRKALRKCTDQITFDRPAFEAARQATPADSLMVIVPTHRSYMDFVLCSYLFFDCPDLGIAIPHIAAADEFSRIPLLGRLFKKGRAFYVKRGLGRENPEVTHQVHRLVDQKNTLEFFIEGTRSRSRQLLPPRRGMLKCLQSTKQTCTILPVTISYDRLPEETAFLGELKGGPKPSMHLRPLLKWLRSLWKGEIHLGRIHLSCGTPLTLDPHSYLPLLGREIVAELQKGLATTTHHLRCFLKQNPELGFDLDWLRDAILRRGGKILESALGGEASIDPVAEKTLRFQWMHLFYGDAQAAFPGHPVIHHHLVRNGFTPFPRMDFAKELADPRLRALLKALFEPVCEDYALVARSVGSSERALRFQSFRDIVPLQPSAFLPNLAEAWEDLLQREILEREEGGAYSWGREAKNLSHYLESCALPEFEAGVEAVG